MGCGSGALFLVCKCKIWFLVDYIDGGDCGQLWVRHDLMLNLMVVMVRVWMLTGLVEVVVAVVRVWVLTGLEEEVEVVVELYAACHYPKLSTLKQAVSSSQSVTLYSQFTLS